MIVALRCLAMALLLSCQSAAGSDEARMSLELVDAPLVSVLELLAAERGLYLQPHTLPDTEHVTVSLADVSLADVLKELLSDLNFDFRIDRQNLYVVDRNYPGTTTFSERSGQESALRVRYLQIHYADPDVMLGLIRGGAGDGLLSDQGSVMLDHRTGTLIVRDNEIQLAEIDTLISELDVPVSQVLIEARIVNASLETGRELGIRWGVSAQRPVADAESGADDILLLFGGAEASVVRFGSIRPGHLLELQLQALESQGQAELMARPRVITQDNSMASIRSGVRIPYQAQAGGTAGGSITQFVDAVLSLEVTPKVTPDGRVMMDLHLRQDSVAAGNGEVPAINTNTVETRVLIDNMDTLVLGGIFREEQTRLHTGTPVLKDLPLLGGLFRRSTTASRRTELLIFITPQIIPAP